MYCSIEGAICPNKKSKNILSKCCHHCDQYVTCEDRCDQTSEEAKNCGQLMKEPPVKDKPSSVEIRLFNHKSNKVTYKRLSVQQLEDIIKLLGTKEEDWI